jgi:hypothetical protein
MGARVSDLPGRMELRWCGVPVLDGMSLRHGQRHEHP